MIPKTALEAAVHQSWKLIIFFIFFFFSFLFFSFLFLFLFLFLFISEYDQLIHTQAIFSLFLLLIISISIFQNYIKLACVFPLYISLAASKTDPLERMKLVITASICSFYYTNTFLKPVSNLTKRIFHNI